MSRTDLAVAAAVGLDLSPARAQVDTLVIPTTTAVEMSATVARRLVSFMKAFASPFFSGGQRTAVRVKRNDLFHTPRS